MQTLVETVEASRDARERTKVILLTLARTWSVEEGCRWLRVGRTRFGGLRRRMLEGAVGALEERAAGRPRRKVERACRELAVQRRRVAELEHELARTRAELDVARGAAAGAVAARLAARLTARLAAHRAAKGGRR